MIEHEPAAAIVTVLPETVQTEVVFETKVTVRPELAVALTVNGATPKVTLLGALKVIVCDDKAGIVIVFAEPTDRGTTLPLKDAVTPLMLTE